MRPSNKQRSRNKQGNGGHNSNNNNNSQRQRMGNIINRVFESAGPDGKVRGTPQQIIDKYQALARDAQVSGDRVAAESFLQHSEHYSRLLGEAQRHQMEQREREEAGRPERPQPQPQDAGFRPQPVQQPPYGFSTIDDDEEPAGLIDTPEGRAEQPLLRPAPVADTLEAAPPAPVELLPEPPFTPVADSVQPEPVPDQAAAAAPASAAAEESEAAPAPRRSRPRRRPKAESPAEPAGEAAAVAE